MWRKKYNPNQNFYLDSLPWLVYTSSSPTCIFFAHRITFNLCFSFVYHSHVSLADPTYFIISLLLTYSSHFYLSSLLLLPFKASLTSPLSWLLSICPLVSPSLSLTSTFFHYFSFYLLSTLLSCLPSLPPKLAPSWKQKSPECCSCIREKGSWSLSPSTSSAQARQHPHSAHPESPDPHPHGLKERVSAPANRYFASSFHGTQTSIKNKRI